MNPSDFSKEEILSRFLQLQDHLEKLNQQNDLKDEKIELLEEPLQQKDDKIEHLEAHPRRYENPHTPPSKRRSATDESPTSQEDEHDKDEDEDEDGDKDDVRTDGETPGRKPGHDPASLETPEPDREVEVTCDCCPACGEDFDESEGVRT